jgi:hypothetical protein
MKSIAVIALILISACAARGECNYNYKDLIEYMQSNHKGIGLVYDEILISNDEKMQNLIKTSLCERKFTRSYQMNVFDCSDMSQIVWGKLKKEGFDAKLVYGIRNDCAHVWVAVKNHHDSKYIVIECTNQSTIGTIMPNGIGKKGYNYKNDIWMLNSSTELSWVFENDGIINNLDPKSSKEIEIFTSTSASPAGEAL